MAHGVRDDPAVLELLGLRVDEAGGRGELTVGPSVLNSFGVLWGGCGLAAAIALGETVLGRAALWATVQYISPIGAAERLQLTLDVGNHGRGFTQAAVRGTVGDRLALLATGTFGGRLAAAPLVEDGQLVLAPTGVTPPDEAADDRSANARTGLRAQFHQRWAEHCEQPAAGRATLWLRPRRPVPASVALLAIMADLAPAALTAAVGADVAAVSLDNSIRVGPGVGGLSAGSGTGWILLDVQVEAFVRGVGQFNARMFDENGRLMATAGQSALVRSRPAAQS
jgi:acyl-CoA thioesterase